MCSQQQRRSSRGSSGGGGSSSSTGGSSSSRLTAATKCHIYFWVLLLLPAAAAVGQPAAPAAVTSAGCWSVAFLAGQQRQQHVGKAARTAALDALCCMLQECCQACHQQWSDCVHEVSSTWPCPQRSLGCCLLHPCPKWAQGFDCCVRRRLRVCSPGAVLRSGTLPTYT